MLTPYCSKKSCDSRLCHLLTLSCQALCHCTDCRKVSGGNYSNNIVVPSENFKILSGTPNQISKIADSGKVITSKSHWKRIASVKTDQSSPFRPLLPRLWDDALPTWGGVRRHQRHEGH